MDSGTIRFSSSLLSEKVTLKFRGKKKICTAIAGRRFGRRSIFCWMRMTHLPKSSSAPEEFSSAGVPPALCGALEIEKLPARCRRYESLCQPAGPASEGRSEWRGLCYIRAPNQSEKTENQDQKERSSVRKGIETLLSCEEGESFAGEQQECESCRNKSAARRGDSAEAG